MLSGSSPSIDLSNHTTFSQTQTDATVPLISNPSIHIRVLLSSLQCIGDGAHFSFGQGYIKTVNYPYLLPLEATEGDGSTKIGFNQIIAAY